MTRRLPVRALVTGAGGFIGTNLCRRLVTEGIEVHALVREARDYPGLTDTPGGVSIMVCDMTDAGRVRKCLAGAAPGVVFHAAAAGGHPATDSERRRSEASTVEATANLLAALVPLEGTMLINLGSALEYGPRPTPHRESDPLEPTTFRGRVKARATQLSRAFAENYGREVVTLRPFSVYGPFEPPSRFIPAALRAASRGTMLPLTVPGIRRDFVFVGDVVEACVRAAALEGWRGEALNVGTGREWSNEEVVEAIRASLGVTLEVAVGRYPRRDVDTEHWRADTTLSARTLGWTPPTGLHDGLRLTDAWMRERP